MEQKPQQPKRRMTDHTSDGENLQLYRHLDSRVSHLDSRVTQLSQDTASIMTKLDSVAAQMGDVAKRVHEPHRTNWMGLVSATVAVITLVVTMGVLSLAPISADLREVKREQNEEVEQLWAEVKPLLGEPHRNEVQAGHLEKLYDAMTEQNARISVLEALTEEQHQ